MFKRILLPVDGSEQSLRAASIGIEMAAHHGAEAVGLEVLAPLASVTWVADFILHSRENHANHAIKRARNHLALIAAIASKTSVRFEDGYIFDRRPYTAIVATADLAGCDLIVIGAGEYAHGDSQVKLSHEMARLLGNTGVPVLVCH